MQGKRKNQVLWLWRVGVLFALIFAVLSIARTVFVFFQARTAFRETAGVSDAIAKREQDIQELEARIAKLRSGEGLEMEARGRLNLQKPEEKVLIIVDDSQKQASSTDEASRAWWQNMLGWIGIAW